MKNRTVVSNCNIKKRKERRKRRRKEGREKTKVGR